MTSDQMWQAYKILNQTIGDKIDAWALKRYVCAQLLSVCKRSQCRAERHFRVSRKTGC